MTTPNAAGLSWLGIKNWAEFQHYKDRNPPWIKLHRALLDDYAFSKLPDHQKAHLIMVWIFGSQNNGKVPHDAGFLAKKLGTTEPLDLDSLIAAGFLIPERNASKALTGGKQDASDVLSLARSQEKRRGEKKSCAVAPHGKDEPAGFTECWNAYPRRSGGNSRKDAEVAYRARLKAGVSPDDLLAGVQRYAAYVRGTGNEGTAYVKQAATFFGTGEHWCESWELPTTAAPSKVAADQSKNNFVGAV